MGIDNRKQKRVILRRQVLLNKSIKTMGLDLSEGGIYVHTGRNCPQGSIVEVDLPLDEQTLQLKARVQHCEEAVGMGLMFVDITPAQKAVLSDFLDRNSAGDLARDSSRPKVLIVDDNPANRRMYKSKLILDGIGVVEAEDGFACLNQLSKEKIDLIVLDLYMDKLDGYKVLSILKQKPEWKDIPVIVISARSTPEEVERAINAGATEFCIKMTTPPVKLSQRIKAYLLK
jgi:CheY-like chemotaxis protein